MKRQAYKIAAMAIVSLITIGTKGFAQQGSSNSSSTTTSSTTTTSSAPAAPAVAGLSGQSTSTYSVYSYNTPGQVYASTLPSVYYGDVYGLTSIQDSAYRKKMQKLQEQMRDLQGQMRALSNEEIKKANDERVKRNAERTKEYQLKFAENEKNFASKFSAVGQRYNYEKNDGDLEKKVASGEVKMKAKAYTKSYTVDGNDKLQINNRFGKITVVAWNKNEFKVDVDIKAYANEDADAQQLLDLVSIKDSKDGDGVSFTTNIGDEHNNNNFWGTRTTNGKTTTRKTVINYTVYMPTKNALSITNTFGAIIVPDFSGKLNIKNQFGNFSAKTLTNTENVINLQYGNATIQSLSGSDLNLSFGSLDLANADKLDADIKFSPAKIGRISTSGKIKLSYGEGLQIGNLDKNLKNLNIASSFTSVKLGSLSNDNADFDVTTQMGGGFTYDNAVSVTSKTPADDEHNYSMTKTYKGRIGKGNSDKVIIIKSSYGSVKFDQ